MLSYTQLLQKLFQVNLFGGIKLGLTNMEQLNEALACPNQSYQTVHIAGTNGKGSVATQIATTLQLSGYKVGLYTSPHLHCFRERIRVNGIMISEQCVEHILNLIFDLIEKQNIPATFFEITTALAFKYFEEQGIDFAVIETGLGGRLDATNIINPILSVITSVSLDHTEILGKSCEEIAREKGGIIKSNIPVVIGPQVPYDIIFEIAKAKNSPCIQVKMPLNSIWENDYREENKTISNQCLKLLNQYYDLNISEDLIQKGILAMPECRFQVLTYDQWRQLSDLDASFFNAFSFPKALIFDVAHNPDGLNRLFKTLRLQYPNEKFRLLFGLSKSKDIIECLKVIASQDNIKAFHVIEARNGRGASAHELANKLKLILGVKRDSNVMSECTEISVYNAIKEASGNNELLIICGTFFIMNEIYDVLGIDVERDDIDLNEKSVTILPQILTKESTKHTHQFNFF